MLSFLILIINILNIAEQIYTLLSPYMAEGTIVYRDFSLIVAHQEEFITLSENNQLLACAGIRVHASCNEMYAFAVAKQHRGKGLGTRLLRKIEAQTPHSLIAISKFQKEWFLINGFKQISPVKLHPEIYYNHQRSPNVFIKDLS